MNTLLYRSLALAVFDSDIGSSALAVKKKLKPAANWREPGYICDHHSCSKDMQVGLIDDSKYLFQMSCQSGQELGSHLLTKSSQASILLLYCKYKKQQSYST